MRYTIPLHIIDLHDDGYHPLLNIRVYGKNFWVVLDTGASKTAFDKSILQIHEEALITDSDKRSTGLGTNDMVSYKAIIPDLFIGKLHIKDFEVAVLDLSTINIAYQQMDHPEVLGVLGGDILVKYKAVIDYGKKEIKFKD